MKIVVAKIGSVLRCLDTPNRRGEAGEVGETLGLLKILKDWGHDVWYHGRKNGTLPNGIRHVDPPLDDVTWDKAHKWKGTGEHDRYMESEAGRVLAAVGGPPDLFIEMMGCNSGRICVDNPKGATINLMTLRYVAPQLGALGFYGAPGAYSERGTPRVVIGTDIRHCPHEADWVCRWPHLMPAAFLAQCTGESKSSAGGVKHLYRRVYSDVWTWWHTVKPRPAQRERARGLVILAHPNMTGGYKQPERIDAFRRVFGNRSDMQELVRLGVEVRGDGWLEQFPDSSYCPELFSRGAVPGGDVLDYLASARACFMVPPSSWWTITAKCLEASAAGAAPIFSGGGYSHEPRRLMPCTYDADGRVYSKTAPTPHRVRDVEDLKLIAELAQTEPEIMEGLSEHAYEKIMKQPRSALEDLLSSVQDGRFFKDTEWRWDWLGGVRPL